MRQRRIRRANNVIRHKDVSTRRYRKAAAKLEKALTPPQVSKELKPRKMNKRSRIKPGTRGFYFGQGGKIHGKPVAHNRKIKKMKDAVEEDE